MQTYIAQRLWMLVPVLFGITVVVFLIIHITPGDPAAIMLAGSPATDADVAQLRHQLGLDRPLHVQFATWVWRALHGDLGRSLALRSPVLPEVILKIKATAVLALGALLLSVFLGILAGVVSSTKQYSLLDYLVMLLSLAGVSLPVFWLGLMLVMVFSVTLGWLPASGMHAPAGGGTGDLLKHLALPAVTLGAASIGVVARFTRSSMLEVLRQDYVRTAQAKGLSTGTINFRHALKNALIPVLTVIGVQAGYLLGGAVLTETVFAWPGLGSLILKGILARDYPLVQGAVLFVACTFVLVNLVVDVLYAYLDPRIHYQ